jgi:hypothetical protein
MTVSRGLGGIFNRAFTGTKSAPGAYEGPGFVTNSPETPAPHTSPAESRQESPAQSPRESPAEGVKESPAESLKEGPPESRQETVSSAASVSQTARVRVGGEVRHPGDYAWLPGLTVRQLVAAAGGLTPEGTDGRLEIVRGAEGREVVADIDAPVRAGETVIVHRRPR